MKLFYKFISVFLCFVITVSMFFCCSIISISAATVTTMYIEGTSVRVRTGPGTNYSIIEKVSDRSATVLDSVQGSDYLWYKVTYFNGKENITGYIAYDANYIRIVTYNPDANFESKLSAFPESYRDSLRALHQEYPNWEFIPEPVTTSFSDAVQQQSINLRKLVQNGSQPISWRSMGPGAYDWNKNAWIKTEGSWYGASREIVAYYMDPRNFLNSKNIYMFLQQGYDANRQTEDGVRKIISGTFMANNYNDPNDTAYGGDYTKVLMEAAKQSGVSPYILASKIRQEIGTTETSMVSGKYPGYEGYYNFYNWGATGSQEKDIIVNGLSNAKANGWNTRSKSIIEGARRYSSGYISVGQDTYYYQDFNVHFPDKITHQYAQAVHDAYSKGTNLSNNYSNEKDYHLVFRIPIFPNMPTTASPLPVKNDKLNNYYLSDMSVAGLTPTFGKYVYNYSVKVSGDTVIKVTPVGTATIATPDKYNLVAGQNNIKISVKSETGYLNDYNIVVNATYPCVLYVNTTGNFPAGVTPSTPTVKRGDTNNDGNISISDIGLLTWNIVDSKKYALSQLQILGGDVNKDGKISISDIGLITWHLIDKVRYPL